MSAPFARPQAVLLRRQRGRGVAAFGLFTSLAQSFLAGTLHRPHPRGAGAHLIFECAMGTVAAVSIDDNRAETLAGLFLAG